jgi:hypothetical protein
VRAATSFQSVPVENLPGRRAALQNIRYAGGRSDFTHGLSPSPIPRTVADANLTRTIIPRRGSAFDDFCHTGENILD